MATGSTRGILRLQQRTHAPDLTTSSGPNSHPAIAHRWVLLLGTGTGTGTAGRILRDPRQKQATTTGDERRAMMAQSYSVLAFFDRRAVVCVFVCAVDCQK